MRIVIESAAFLDVRSDPARIDYMKREEKATSRYLYPHIDIGRR